MLAFSHRGALLTGGHKTLLVLFHHDRDRVDPAKEAINCDHLEAQKSNFLPIVLVEILKNETGDLEYRDDTGHISGQSSEAQHKDRVGQEQQIFNTQPFRPQIKACREDLFQRSFLSAFASVQCIIERKLLEHCPRDQKKSQKDEHDPCKRIFDNVKQVGPRNDRRFIADKPKPLQTCHCGKQHKKSEEPEVHFKRYYVSKVLLHQPEGLHDCKKTSPLSRQKSFSSANTSRTLFSPTIIQHNLL